MAYRPPHRQLNQRKQPPRQQQHPTAHTNLDWLPSVSRSGGLDGDGDSLKDHRIQERYRAWIEEKVLEYEKSHAVTAPEKDVLVREDIVRRFRKLREGVLASNRQDKFAIEVYETSLVLASAYGATEQATAVSAQILPLSRLELPICDIATKQALPRELILFLILLHHLMLSVHSSLSLRWVITAISHPHVCTALRPQRLSWLKQLRLNLKSHNYRAVWDMTTNKNVDILLDDMVNSELVGRRESAAVFAEVQLLQDHVRDIAWGVMRAAYREESETWLISCLCLSSNPAGWLVEKQKLQEALLVPKDPTRWKIFKPKAV